MCLEETDMISKKINNKRGFTVVELLVAVVVMSIAFAGLATMEVACINGTSIANNVTTGITLAQDKMEELKSLHLDDPELDDNNPSNNADLRAGVEDYTVEGAVSTADDGHRDEDIDADGNPGGMYTRSWNIAEDTPIDGEKTIVVIVTWKDHIVTVTSII
jgi:prepilin-type N-terminal cleavage/methylation domain-containing protein